MIIDYKQYFGPCHCGQSHNVTTDRAVIEAGSLRNFDALLSAAQLPGRRAAIYDSNTYNADGLTRPHVDQEIILPAAGLCADDRATAYVLQQLSSGIDVLVAIGSGAIHDIVRYCAHRLSLPFVACPTAASGDGFSGDQCAMVWRGTRTIMPGVAPTLVIADLDVIRRAPLYLARAGVGDALGKFTSLADWRIASLLKGEPACPTIESILHQAAIAAQGACAGLESGDEGAYAQLMYALMLPGLAMQMAGSAHPASAAEHMMSDLMDLAPEIYGPRDPLTHGGQIGVCATVIADLYHRIAEAEDIAPYILAYEPPDMQLFTQSLGHMHTMTLMRANSSDCLEAIDAERLSANWPEIRRIIAEIPSGEELSNTLASVGAENSMNALGIPAAKVGEMLKLAPNLRNQLTLARMLRILHDRAGSNAKVSHAASRRSRYADSAMTRAGSSSAVSASSM